MDPFWRDHWWLIIPLAAFTIPLTAIVFSSLNLQMHYRHRREALELIRTYAAQGKDPPAELLAQLDAGRVRFGAGRGGYDLGLDPAGPDLGGPDLGAPGAGYGFAGDARAAARAARHAARAERYAMRSQYWQWRGPLHRWNRAIFLVAIAGGFYVASLYARDPDTMGRFQIGAIILGALAAAAVLSAVMSALIRPK